MEQRCGRTDHHLGPGWHQPLENRDESSGDQRPVHDRRTGSRGHVNRARREDGRHVPAEGVAGRRTLRAGSGGEFGGRSAGNTRIASWHCRQSIRVGNASRGDEGLTGRKASARGAPRSVRSRLPGRGSPGSADVSRGHLAKDDEESLRLRAYVRRGIFPDYVGRKNTSHRNIQLRGIRWESSQTLSPMSGRSLQPLHQMPTGHCCPARRSAIFSCETQQPQHFRGKFRVAVDPAAGFPSA